MDRASGFEPEGRGFKSLRACQEQSKVKKPLQKCRGFSVNCCNFVVTALNKYLLMVLIARFEARARVKFEVRGDWLLSASCPDKL